MDKLENARKVISDADKAIAELFEKRMTAVRAVAEYKKERGLPVLDEAREAALIEKNSGYIADSEIKEYYVNFHKYAMKVSRDFQHRLIEGARIAYSGDIGAFAHTAAKSIFPDGIHVPCKDFDTAYLSVVSGDCDSAVLPIENSFAGDVGQVTDLLFSGSLYINNVVDLPVTQDLLAIPGASISDIKKVVSHPQALDQSAKYIKAHGFETVPYSNTALAAKYVKELGDKSVGAIASEEAAKYYGLDVLASRINESDSNTTRFAVVSRVESENSAGDDNHFIIMFTVKNEAGSLADAINIIGKHGYNMRSLRSRPMKTLMWQYYFFVEAEGNVRSDDGKQMMEELRGSCDKLKLVGSYKTK